MAKVSRIRKRDGSIEPFQPQKIENAILKALLAVGREKKAKQQAQKLAKQVVTAAQKHWPTPKVIPSVEDVQDIVEETLVKARLADVVKAYILYRQKHKEFREFKTFLGVRDDLKMPPNAIKVLARRYLLRNDKGQIIETPSRLFQRVAKAVASIESMYKRSARKAEQEFYNLMANREFIPNTPTLMNAGTELSQLSACFVLPVGDSLEEIFETLKHTSRIHQSGGGTGFSFSRLRPRGDIVKSTKGVASGPVSFMKIYDTMTEVVRQGGKRRGANMGILNCDHPDIIEFITSKLKPGEITNFNISVGANSQFMQAVEKDTDWPLVNPRTKKVIRSIRARELWRLIIDSAWKSGDPGMIWLDEINKHNPTAPQGEIEATNPCGEQPLHPYESCNLGSINVGKFVKNKKVEWERLKRAIHSSVRFLDNVIDANKYPIPEIEEITKKNRRIGLGIMGWAEMLIQMGIPYDSKKALDFADKFMKFFATEARKASNKLAEDREPFPGIAQSTFSKQKKPIKTRNATVTTIAPTGTIAIIAGASSGIEPLFAVSFVREVMEGTRLLEVNELFEQIARKRGFYSKALMMRIAKKGSIQKVKGIPRDIQRLFVTALDIKPEWHVKMQAVFQKYVDNAVSKTINLPENATPKHVEDAYWLAWKLKCKGITIYRYGSKPTQVLYIGKPPQEEVVAAASEYAGGPLCEECVH